MKAKRYVVTSAQASYQLDSTDDGDFLIGRGAAKLHKPFMESLEHYCDVNDAELIILPMRGKDARETEFHESLDAYEIFTGERTLNSNLKISDMKVPPQNVDPTTGRLRFAQQDRTLIYPHTKQRFKAVPSSNYKHPKLLLTTGSITEPNYNESNHKGDVARRDHILGAVIAEVIDDHCYNVRHIRAQKNGKFNDMGWLYDGNKCKPSGVEALVLGDLHVGDTCDLTRQANYEMIEYFRPKRLMLHDVFNGHSINPHEKANKVMRTRNWKTGRLDLETELRECGEELKNLTKAMKGQVYVVKSNHDVFLERYLETGDFMNEPWNAEMAMRLAYELAKGNNPLEEGIKFTSGVPKRLHFLELTSDLKVEGYQLASHGHKGNSGSRNSSIRSRETAHGKSVTGHSHTPETLRDTHIVGTSTRLNLPYTEGSAGSWLAANAVLYKGGQIQILPVIGGKWEKE
jgi:hypothetical protein